MDTKIMCAFGSAALFVVAAVLSVVEGQPIWATVLCLCASAILVVLGLVLVRKKNKGG